MHYSAQRYAILGDDSGGNNIHHVSFCVIFSQHFARFVVIVRFNGSESELHARHAAKATCAQ